MGWNLCLNEFAFSLLNGSHSLNGPWDFGSPRGAFQVEGTVPEPATMLLLGPVLVLMALRVHRRKTGKGEIP
jgi:hypothetical protein